MTNEGPKTGFWLLTVLALLCSLGGGTLVVAQIDAPDFLEPVEDALQGVGLIAVIAGTALPVLLIVAAYWMSLRLKGPRRPVVGLYLLGFSLFWLIAAYVATSIGSEMILEPIPGAVVAVALLALSLAPRLIEIVLGRTTRAAGNALLNKEHWQAAVSMLGVAHRLLPGDEKVACNRGLALYEIGEAEQALETLIAAYRRGERDPRLIRTLADSVFDLPEDLAIEILQDTLKIDPNNAKFGRKLVELHLKHERPGDAIPVLEKFYNSDSLEDVCLLSRLHAEQGNVRRALKHARRAMEIEDRPYKRTLADLQILAMQAPENPEVLQTLAEVNEDIGNYDEAASWYLDLLEVKEDDGKARRRLIHLYRELGRPDQAIPHYRHLLRQEPDSPAVALEYGQLLEDREDFDKALKVFRDFSERYPDDWRFPYHCAICLHGLGNLDEAEQALERARSSAPSSERSKVQSLGARIRKSRVDGELTELRKRAHSQDASLDFRLEFVQRLIEYQQAEEAARELDLLLEEFPEEKERIVNFLETHLEEGEAHFVLLNLLADIYLKARDFDRCHRLYERMAEQSLHPDEILADGCRQILRIQPDHLPSLKSHARLMVKSGHHREAARVLQKILEISPQARDELLPMLFEVYYQMGDAERAIPYGEELLKKDSPNLNLFLRMRELMVKRDDHAGAIRILKRALKVAPENRQLREMIEQSETQIKKDRIAALEGRLEVQPDDPQTRKELADLYMEFDRLNDAITAYQRAAQNGAGNMRNLCLIRLAHCLANKQMFDLADETHSEMDVDKKEAEYLEEIKDYLYRVGELFEEDEQFARALKIYKHLFKIDAGYRDIVDKIEMLSHFAK